MTTYEKLEQLARLQDYLSSYESTRNDTREALTAEQQALIDSILTPEILAKVEEIKSEFAPKFEALENDTAYLAKKQEADTLTAEIKDDVVSAGETIKGSCLMAVYVKGRVSWDTKALDGYCVAHPEVEQFKKIGDPSVAIRKA